MTHTIGGFKIIAAPYLLPESSYRRREKTNRVLVSHEPESDGVDADDLRERDIADGLTDLTYHFVVQRDGTIERVRPTWAVGYGRPCGSMDCCAQDAIHVCLIGEDPTEAQQASMKFLVASLRKLTTNNIPDPELTVVSQEFVGAFLH